MAEADFNGETPFFIFLEKVEEAYEQTQRDLKEINILINQSAAEVERLAQRNAQSVNRLRQLQSNFDTQPRDYIREVYEAQNDIQQRLFTMRGQLEKLQSDQRNLEKLAAFQRELVQLTTGMTAVPPAGGSAKPRLSAGDKFSIIRVIQTEEAAKQSLVREMHDGPASALSNFILQAEICQRFFDVDPDRARAELNALKNAAATTFSDIKDFIFDLRPMMLDDLGVVPTLRRYVESFQEKNDLAVPITVTGVERRLESYVEVTIFRGVQELLNNALAHAQPTQIQVLLDMAQNQVTAVVDDNGSGFNADEALSETSKTIGLSSLQQRIETLGGQLTIQSRLGKGSRIEFSVPIEMDMGI